MSGAFGRREVTRGPGLHNHVGPISPWLFSQPCYPFRTPEGSWDMVRGPAATTWAPSRQPVLGSIVRSLGVVRFKKPAWREGALENLFGGPAELSGALWRRNNIRGPGMHNHGIPLIPMVVPPPLLPFSHARGPLGHGSWPRSYDLGSFPPALTGGRGLGVEGETGHGDKKRVLQEWG